MIAEIQTEKLEGLSDLLGSFRQALLNSYFPAQDEFGNPSVSRFFMEHGRLPHVEDEIKPWTYPGWQLPYVMEMYRRMLPASDRYTYYLDTLDAGRLTAAPIPQIRFGSEFDQKSKPIRKYIENWEMIAATGRSVWDGFRILVDWLAFSFGIEREPVALDEKTQEALYRAVNIFPLLENPSDHFGSYLAEKRAGGWNPNAFFPTPHTVVEMMTQITFSGKKDFRAELVEDCALGTGRMLLHASNYSLRLYGMDIDPLVVKICKINGALYAPWMTFPFPESFFGGDEEMPAHDETKEKLTAAEPAAIDEDLNPDPAVIAAPVTVQDIMNRRRRQREKGKFRLDESQGLLFDV